MLGWKKQIKMGFAYCRFREETDCSEMGSQHYNVHLSDLDVMINVPSMWKHYMTEHLIQPTQREREFVMAADPNQATGTLITTRSQERPKELRIMYVEKNETGYSHQIGTQPDIQFIDKLETILNGIQPSI